MLAWMLIWLRRFFTSVRVRRAIARREIAEDLQLRAEQEMDRIVGHYKRSLEYQNQELDEYRDAISGLQIRCSELIVRETVLCSEHKERQQVVEKRLSETAARLAEAQQMVKVHESTIAVKEHEIELLAKVAARDLMRIQAETAVEAAKVALATNGNPDDILKALRAADGTAARGK